MVDGKNCHICKYFKLDKKMVKKLCWSVKIPACISVIEDSNFIYPNPKVWIIQWSKVIENARHFFFMN